jgi:hypothetical protein
MTFSFMIQSDPLPAEVDEGKALVSVDLTEYRETFLAEQKSVFA